jgi:hypothetical protein
MPNNNIAQRSKAVFLDVVSGNMDLEYLDNSWQAAIPYNRLLAAVLRRKFMKGCISHVAVL